MAKESEKKKDGGGGAGLLLFLVLAAVASPGILLLHFIDKEFDLSLDTGQFWTFGVIACVAIFGVFWVGFVIQSRSSSDWDTPSPWFSASKVYLLVSGSSFALALISHFGFHAKWPREAYHGFFPSLVDPPEYRFEITVRARDGRTFSKEVTERPDLIDSATEQHRTEVLWKVRNEKGISWCFDTKDPVCADDFMTASSRRLDD